MRLLLDTYIWIWSYLEPHKISSEVTRELTNPGNDRFLSAVSVWEAIVLLDKKRIQFRRDFGEWFRESKDELNLNEVPVS
jgi:PIN domain nuclease of toxin-antitoxin system